MCVAVGVKVSVAVGVNVGVGVIVLVGVGVPVRVGVKVGNRVGMTRTGVSVKRGDQVCVGGGEVAVIVGPALRFTDTKKYPRP